MKGGSAASLLSSEEEGYQSPGDALLAAAKRTREQEKLPLLAPRKLKKRRKAVQQFYTAQSAFVNDYKADKDLLNEFGDMEEGDIDPQIARDEAARKTDELLAKITFGFNVLMLILKIIAAVLSGSLSVISTVIDSGVDITSGLVIWMTMRAIENRDPYEYPRGRNRLEPLAVIIVSIIMGVANIVMIIQSVEMIINDQVAPVVDAITIGILLFGTAVKVVLYFFCIRQKSTSSAVLAVDQRNDVITNIVALAGAVVGYYEWKYADPIGAILVCSWVAGSWFFMAADQVPVLSGKTASKEFINRIIRVAISHDERIKCLDTVLVYHFGSNFLVELHVVMDEHMSLKESHNIAAPLQDKLERLPYVERAFVHCDYELDGVSAT